MNFGTIAIVDYGMGNLASVLNALGFLGIESVVTRSAHDLQKADGIILPGVGAFGEAMINLRSLDLILPLTELVVDQRKPFLGICLGMQLAVIETARNVAGLKDANSTELAEKTKSPVISLMLEQRGIKQMGGTMRLGGDKCVLAEGTHSKKAYAQNEITERHRHRYEFNNSFKETLEEAGLVIAGVSPDGLLVEIVERKDHPWFVACQFHPEFKSTPLNSHPLFRDFISASIANRDK